jgi:hydrogenase 3 maturation protease
MTKTMIMCIGNPEGGDDGIGPYIAQHMKKTTSTDMILDCGTTPENYTATVKKHKPDTLLLIDAADMNLPPGTLRRIPKEKLGTMHISTHGIPLRLLIQYLEKEVQHIIIIGIQPHTMNGPLSNPAKKSADHLIDILKTKNIQQIPQL